MRLDKGENKKQWNGDDDRKNAVKNGKDDAELEGGDMLDAFDHNVFKGRGFLRGVRPRVWFFVGVKQENVSILRD